MSVMTSDRKRFAMAFIAAPLVPAAPLLAISLAGNPLEGIWGFAVITPVAYLAEVFPGAVLYLVCRRLGLVSALTCVLIGMVSGAVTTFYFMRNSMTHAWAAGPAANWYPSVMFAVIAGMLGSMAGYVFWKISAGPDQQKVAEGPASKK